MLFELGKVFKFSEEVLLEVDVLLLMLLRPLHCVQLQLLVLCDPLLIFVDLPLEAGDVALLIKDGDDVLDVSLLLLFLIEFFLGFREVGSHLHHLLIVLQEEGEVLGPGENGRVRLAVLIVLVGSVCEGFLDLLQDLAVALHELVVHLKVGRDAVHQALDEARVACEDGAHIAHGYACLHLNEANEALQHGVQLRLDVLVEELVQVLDQLGSDALLYLDELVSERLDLELRIVKLCLSLLDLLREDDLSALETGHLKFEVLLLLLKLLKLLLLDENSLLQLIDHLSELALLGVLSQALGSLELLTFALLTMLDDDVEELLASLALELVGKGLFLRSCLGYFLVVRLLNLLLENC